MNGVSSTRIIFFIPTLGLGGAEGNTVNLANNFVSEGYEVEIVTVLRCTFSKDRFDSKVKITELNCRKMINSIFKIKRILKSYPFAKCVSNLWPLNFYVFFASLLSSRIKNTLFVEHVNLSIGLEHSSITEKIAARLFYCLISFFPCRVISVSEGVARDLERHFFLSRSSIDVIYNPVIPCDHKYLSVKTMSDAECLRLLTVANFKIQKDYPNLISALSYLRYFTNNFHLTIVGDGPERSRITNQIREERLTDFVSIVGHVNNPRDYFLDAHIYVCASRWEGLGNSMIEALAFGCSVVSTDCPSGPAEILRGGDFGTLVPVADPAALAAAIYSRYRDNSINSDGLVEHLKRFRVDLVSRRYLESLRLRAI